MDIRTGNGFDVHAFGPGDGVTLCGVAHPPRPRPRRPFRRRRRPARPDRRRSSARSPRATSASGSRPPTRSGRAPPRRSSSQGGGARRARGFAITHLDVHAGLRGPEDRPPRRRHARRRRRHRRASTPSGSASRRPPPSASASPAAARASPRSPPQPWSFVTAMIAPAATALTRAIATFGYVGFLPGPAGTWGSLAALADRLPPPRRSAASPSSPPPPSPPRRIGCWATHVETREQDDLDPGQIVIDEVAGQWIALWPLSLGMWHIGAPADALPLAGLGLGLPRSSASSTSGSPGRSPGPTAARARPA